jgi:hypothetical protein
VRHRKTHQKDDAEPHSVVTHDGTSERQSSSVQMNGMYWDPGTESFPAWPEGMSSLESSVALGPGATRLTSRVPEAGAFPQDLVSGFSVGANQLPSENPNIQDAPDDQTIALLKGKHSITKGLGTSNLTPHARRVYGLTGRK